MNIRIVAACAVALSVLGAQAARRTVLLSGEGWTCDGEKVSVPHSWNGTDGADGKPVEGIEPVLLPALATAQTSAPANTYLRKAAVYARTLPDPVAGKRYFIRCEGASIKAEVRVNGTAVGRHAGAFTAFAFEVTKVLKPKGNRLEIEVDSRYDPDVPPIMGDFTLFGGLYRDVWLIETDSVCIDPLRDGGPGVDVTTFADGRVEANTFVSGAESAAVTYEIAGREYATGSFKVPDVAPWSPETPRVYELKVTMRSGASEDSVVLPVGFRNVKFTKDGFFLNGKRRVIRGVNRHQDWEGKGWAISKADERADVGWMKRMGADGVRGCHYPQSDSYYSVCDSEGLMAWCEVSFVNDMTDSAAFRSNLLTMAREMVAQRKHHPSIVCWGLFNELYSCTKTSNGTMEPLIRDEKALIKALDPSRVTVAASNRLRKPELNSIPDFVTFNVYHGWYGGRYNDEWWYEGEIDGTDDLLALKMLRKLREANGLDIVGLGEYGAAGAVAIHGDYLGGVRYSEEYQALVHRANYRAIIRDPKVWGAFIWEMFDSGSDSRQEVERPGINNKGLVTYDRKEAKDAFWFYKANWNPEPMLHLVGSRMTETTNATVTVCGFCNVGPVSLTVNGQGMGTLKPDDVNCVIWKGVPLSPGSNAVELHADGLRAVANWTRKANCSENAETAMWQSKIDAVGRKGGGCVVIPPGIHRVGGLRMRSNVELHLEEGAELDAMAGMENYNLVELPYSEGVWSAVVMGIGVTNVAITGKGVINGRGGMWPEPTREDFKRGCQEGLRPRGVFFANSSDIRLFDFTLRDAACWGIVIKACDGLTAKRVRIDSHANWNNDGFDIEARNVLIEDCEADTGDDAFVIKSNDPSFICENIVFRRCTARGQANAFKIGTATHGVVRNVRYEDIRCGFGRRVCTKLEDGTPMKLLSFHYMCEVGEKYPTGCMLCGLAFLCVDGGAVEDVVVDGLEIIDGVREPIFIRSDLRQVGMHSVKTKPNTLNRLRNIRITNVRGRAMGPYASAIVGVDGFRIENVVLKDIEITVAGAGEEASRKAMDTPVPYKFNVYPTPDIFWPHIFPAYGLYVDRADDIRIENVRFRLDSGTTDMRPEFVGVGARVEKVAVRL